MGYIGYYLAIIPWYCVGFPLSPIETRHIYVSPHAFLVLHFGSNRCFVHHWVIFSCSLSSLCLLGSIYFCPHTSFQSEGKSIALIQMGLLGYPSFLPSRIALFFNLQLSVSVILSSHLPPSCNSGHPTFSFFLFHASHLDSVNRKKYVQIKICRRVEKI